MEFRVRPEVIIFYPTAKFGSLAIYNQPNQKKHRDLEEAKRQLEKIIRETYPDPMDDSVIQSYQDYYSRWEKTYPIEFQIRSIKKGRTFPQVSTHVDCMFLAELEDRILTSGHDADDIQGTPTYDLADQGEEYTKLNGRNQVLVKNDVVLRDDEGVLASILFGPALRTSIALKTINPVYFSWCPIGITTEVVENHLSSIRKYLQIVYENIQFDHKILKKNSIY
jgi:DNA/RNA-binding domain of Phe-tRNA-synthetase-like protein